MGAGLREIDFDTARALLQPPAPAVRHDFLPDDGAPVERCSFRFVDRLPVRRVGLVATLAACGGGGSTGGDATALDATTASARALDASAAPEGDWVRIADENQTFSVQGTQTVRYGSGSSWIVKSVSDGGECSNSGFGTDPLVGVSRSARSLHRGHRSPMSIRPSACRARRRSATASARTGSSRP